MDNSKGPLRATPEAATKDPLYVAALAIALGCGVVLRVWRAGSAIPFQDEVHSVGSVVQHGYGWIATHTGAFDHCIPLTLYYELLSRTIGLGEWGMRMPSLLAGCAALVFFAAVARRTLRPSESLLAVGLLALSPYVVYLTREARPYPTLLFLFLVAAIHVYQWLQTGGRRPLCVAALASALALYFHPVVLPSIAILAALPLWRLARQAPSDREWLNVAIAAGLFGALSLLLLGPAVADLVEQSAQKVGRGQFDLVSLRAGLMLLHGSAFNPPLWLQIAWAIVAVSMLAARYRVEVLSLVAMVIAQLAVIAWTQPTMSEQSFVWLRYLAHLLPFLAVVAITPLAWLLDTLQRRLPLSRMALIASSIALVLFGASHVAASRYALTRGDAYNLHPWLLYLMTTEAAAALPIPSAFYLSPIETEANASAIIEAPWAATFPVYAIYQRHHHRRIYAGVGEGGYWAKYFYAAPGVEFASVVDLAKLSAETRPKDAGLLIWHKRIRAETGAAMSAAADQLPAGLHSPPEHRFAEFLDLDFGRRGPELPSHIPRDFPTVYEDDAIRVFSLSPKAD